MVSKGPLLGIKVVELAGLAPAPFAGMILADFGADVIRVDRANSTQLGEDRLARGKRSISIDLKQDSGINLVRKLCKTSDVLIEPFRPGVMEKLGLGPQVLMADNPGLVYARLTGFGQTGPWKDKAGHDINYLALSGILSMLGRKRENPLAPLNLVADFAGGGLICALGIVMALFERRTSGKGQLVDVSMAEGAAYVGSWLFRSRDLSGLVWTGDRGENLLDSGFPLYEVYETSDGKFVSVGALEPQFQKAFLEKMGLSDQISLSDTFTDRERVKTLLISAFLSQTSAYWLNLFDQSTNTCVAPVLTIEECHSHPHNTHRAAFHKNPENGHLEPKPAPLLSRTPGVPKDYSNPSAGHHSREILEEMGFGENEIQQLKQSGVVAGGEKSKL